MIFKNKAPLKILMFSIMSLLFLAIIIIIISMIKHQNISIQEAVDNKITNMGLEKFRKWETNILWMRSNDYYFIINEDAIQISIAYQLNPASLFKSEHREISFCKKFSSSSYINQKTQISVFGLGDRICAYCDSLETHNEAKTENIYIHFAKNNVLTSCVITSKKNSVDILKSAEYKETIEILKMIYETIP